MQGRTDIVDLLLKSEQGQEMCRILAEDQGKTPPSLPHLAVANDHSEAARW